MTTPVVVCGRSGRMAGLIADAVSREPDLHLTARLSTRPQPAADVLAALADLDCDRPPVVVDFTAREATAALLVQARNVPCSLVIGTSGLGESETALLEEAGRHRAIVTAANFSVALLAVAGFVRDLSGRTDDSWDAGVLDIHFTGKRDRPSATARLLAAQWRAARTRRRGRPETGEEGAEEAPDIAAFRIGNAVSEHRILAAGPGEHVEVVHRVADRTAFLPGILRSVRFAADAPPGLYSLEDVACERLPAALGP
ncbi:4-hydroxy-tetrahydrodipicolinate reductase [Streptomyces fagopyri]|uniref:4-hydroxy-tetrahydrodipicolinate reductase n=1 Tax=Streptomyces fagopyri TaxID=2662397 RepID=UPI0037F22C4C